MNKDFYKIIAIRINNIIYFGQRAIDELNKEGNYQQLLSLRDFKMLARMDLDDKWHQYAEHSPILFELAPDTPFEIRMPNSRNF